MAIEPYIIKCSKCKVAYSRSTTRPFLCARCRENRILYTRTYYLNKKVAYKRDNYTCQCCRTKKNILSHHIDCRRNNNSPSNLITLCNQCHMSLHRKYTRKELRESNIYKLFPKKFKIGIFGRRPVCTKITKGKKRREYKFFTKNVNGKIVGTTHVRPT